jgi:hypothetical protein
MAENVVVRKISGSGRAAGTRRAVEGFLRPLVGGLALLLALAGLIGTAIRDPRPHDIPVGLVGPAAATQQIAGAFGANAPGAFRFSSYESEPAARAAIDARQIDGALVVGPGGPKLIVAGAAGDAVAGLITAAFTNVFQAQGARLTVESVHQFASGDPHGLILFFLLVAVFISTLVSQAIQLATMPGAGFAARLGVTVAYAILAGLVAAATGAWLGGGYGDGFGTVSGLFALGSVAIGAVTAGAVRLLGPAGLGLSALVAVVLDLVCSGWPAGSDLLPDFYRWLAPGMPAPQLYSALRGALYFDGAGVAMPVLGLLAWLVGGIVLMLLGELARRRRAAPAAAA